MNLNPRERDVLTVSHVGLLAQRRLARGIKLSYSEAIGLITLVLLEKGRGDNNDNDDVTTVSDLMELGRSILGRNNVKYGVPEMIHTVQIEITFPDGVKLVTVHNPISGENGDLELALFGSFLPVPEKEIFTKKSKKKEDNRVIAGQIWSSTPEKIILNEGKETILLNVTNLSDRPIQVGSHYHFIECNPHLQFDRRLAYGRRLNISAGTAVRFEPSESKTVSLVPIGGKKLIQGGNALCKSIEAVEVGNPPSAIMDKIINLGFQHQEQTVVEAGPIAAILREVYVHSFGPTTGDLVRLGDTNLILRVEKDLAGGKNYGDEVKFGGGKVIRDGMGQSSLVSGVDTVITNALIVDYTAIYKADIGITDGFICGIGKAGNPDCQDSVEIVIGNGTEVIAGEGLILTAGGIDAHVHFICPELATVAVASGLTSLIGGGTGPAAGTCATTCTPSPNHMKLMMQATDHLPLNLGFTGKGNCSSVEPLKQILDAGAVGLKLHEDWGTTPAAIDTCLSIAEDYDVQVNIHTDTLNESCMCEGTIEAFKGRTIHTYHSEGAGGGHAPDIIRVCGIPNVLPSSTNPSNPFTTNTIDEHLDMLMVCHHLDPTIKEDLAFAESRIRAETIAAEDILHDMGAISIMSSDSQAMGRIGEVICRTWQTAHKMKAQRGTLSEDKNNASTVPKEDHTLPIADNERIKRYIAKYTINPAIAHGVSDLIGSVELNKLADLVLWDPSHFGIKPSLVIKGGYIAYAQMGDANASIPTPEPVMMRPMFASYIHNNSYIFCNQRSSDNVSTNYSLKKNVYPVRGCRGLSKKDMKCNTALPVIEVDPETHQVKADGELLSCEPIDEVPLGQNYSIF